jgi:hypothetical protein
MSSNTQIIPDGAYNALRQLFEDNLERKLEIEILPPAISPPDTSFFIQDELSIGIPKKVLVSAFLRAREIFANRNQIIVEEDYTVGETILMVLIDLSDDLIGSHQYYNYNSPLRSGIPDSSQLPQGATSCNST